MSLSGLWGRAILVEWRNSRSRLTTRLDAGRLLSSVGYHHVLMVFSVGSIILFSILLAGCSSSNLSNVYLLSLQYKTPSSPVPTDSALVSTTIADAIRNITKASNQTILEVRAGYMGLCLVQSNEAQTCLSSASKLASIVRQTTNSSNQDTPDPLNLIYIANEFKEKIVFDGLIFISLVLIVVSVVILSTFPSWHEEVNDHGEEIEVKPFPSMPLTQAVLGASTVAFAFGLISALWQHINASSTVSMAETLTYGEISGHVGPAAMALGWIGVVLIGVVVLGLVVMVLNITLLRRLTDDDEDEDE